eukprot:Blabericola_migrator_1__4055@NODE_2235_length_3076_cov_13_810568_g1408_i0_p2_GENE_NODE_2235_length_3076_cov_13_810568_g1408_i0NODE_2235_length_3076_cov_13_810568_g1408_i0_p2_ORF_typecomplete_len126_score13_13_NODE_2235_length_3076_cov_13_810568_g1408_i012751652
MHIEDATQRKVAWLRFYFTVCAARAARVLSARAVQHKSHLQEAWALIDLLIETDEEMTDTPSNERRHELRIRLRDALAHRPWGAVMIYSMVNWLPNSILRSSKDEPYLITLGMERLFNGATTSHI